MNNEELFAAIEAKSSFAVPSIYRQLHNDGVLRDIEPGEWQQHWQNWSITRPLPLLHHPERPEWFSLAEIAEFEQPNYWREDLTFVPFAHNGAGDWWCWLPQWSTEGQTPVAFCPHDLNQSSMFSPDFESFLFRMILEMLARTYPDPFSPAALEQAIRTDLAQLQPYFRLSWQNTINEIIGQEYRRIEERGPIYTDVYYSFCPETEIGRVIERELKFDRLDETFQHMKR